MVTCKINGRQYLVDVSMNEYYSVSTSKTFTFGDDFKVKDLAAYLAEHDK